MLDNIEERLNEGARIQSENKNKRNATERQHGIGKTKNTPGEYKFATLVVANRFIWRANEHACFGLSSPWFKEKSEHT